MESPSHPPKVLYVITKANYGGAQRYVLDLAIAARNRGFEVSVAYGVNGKLRELLEEVGVRTYHLNSMGRDVAILSDLFSFFALLHLFWKLSPDVVHLNSSKVGALGALAARLSSVKHIIFTAHGWASTENRPDWQKLIITAIHWITVLLTHQTIAVSEHTKMELVSYPFMRKRISVVHNAAPKMTFHTREEARATLFKGHTVPHADIWIGMIAELHKNKAVDLAIRGFEQIASQFPKTILVVIGEGEERVTLEKSIIHSSLQERVFLVGFKEEAARLLHAFDLCMMTSHKEGFPYAVLEAGQAGLPMIASAVGGIPEAIQDMSTGVLIHPQNPQEISRALAMYLTDEKRRIDMGKRFQKDILERFSFEKMTERTFAHYGLEINK